MPRTKSRSQVKLNAPSPLWERENIMAAILPKGLRIVHGQVVLGRELGHVSIIHHWLGCPRLAAPTVLSSRELESLDH